MQINKQLPLKSPQNYMYPNYNIMMFYQKMFDLQWSSLV